MVAVTILLQAVVAVVETPSDPSMLKPVVALIAFVVETVVAVGVTAGMTSVEVVASAAEALAVAVVGINRGPAVAFASASVSAVYVPAAAAVARVAVELVVGASLRG